jgi:hypothetical protein
VRAGRARRARIARGRPKATSRAFRARASDRPRRRATAAPLPQVFINFARVIVPARIALALALAPWCDRNIIQKYFPEKTDDECVIEE